MTQIKPTTVYKLKVFLLALVGYFYIFLMPAIFLADASLLIWTIVTGKGLDGPLIYIEIALLIVAAKFVHALWLKATGGTSGYVPLDETNVPRLFETIQEIRTAIRGPQVHNVVLSNQFDLALTPVPRGLFGGSRNELDVGMLLMRALTPAQFRALLTHELGHFTGSRLGTWIYRIRDVWQCLLWPIDQRGRLASWLFNRLFRRYVRYFRNYSFTLARAREYEADRLAAGITTPEVTADALIRFAYEDCFDMQNEEALQRYLDYLLAAESTNYNSHPAMKDRLKALGQEARLPMPVGESAADVYFADSLSELIRQLEGTQEEVEEDPWGTSPAAEVFKRAKDAESTGNKETALLLYREALRLDPNHAPANVALGKMLLSDNNGEGIHFLERAIDLGTSNLYYCFTPIFHYMMKNGDPVGAASYRHRLAELRRLYINAYTERTQVSFVERFRSHDLPEGEVEQLRHELAKQPRIREAYLVRKELQYIPEKPLYVMGLVFDRQSDEDLGFTERFPRALKDPRELHSFVLDHRNRRVGTMIRNVSNSLIYRCNH